MLVALEQNLSKKLLKKKKKNTQLPPTDDGEWFLWKFQNQTMWVLKISIKFCLYQENCVFSWFTNDTSSVG